MGTGGTSGILSNEPKVALFLPHVFLITRRPLQIARDINMLTKDEILVNAITNLHRSDYLHIQAQFSVTTACRKL